jgi:hypothetical protein
MVGMQFLQRQNQNNPTVPGPVPETAPEAARGALPLTPQLGLLIFGTRARSLQKDAIEVSVSNLFRVHCLIGHFTSFWLL